MALHLSARSTADNDESSRSALRVAAPALGDGVRPSTVRADQDAANAQNPPSENFYGGVFNESIRATWRTAFGPVA
jgi:hypothetical protein